MTGFVEAVLVAPAEALPMRRVRRVTAMPGVGLSGDRYATNNGYWSGDNKVSRDVTLVEAEAIEDVADQIGLEIGVEELRRNIVVRGVPLNDLVGARFRIGSVIVEGTSLCEPCLHLARTIGKPLMRQFVHRAGLRANILSPGEMGLGDSVELDAPNVGVAVVVRSEGRYLLGRRLAQRGRGTWSTPGGAVRPGEGVLACAVRELAEETALDGRAPRVIGHRLDAVDGVDWCSVFVAVDVAGDSAPRVAEVSKTEAWEWFEPSTLPTPLFGPVRALMSADRAPASFG